MVGAGWLQAELGKSESMQWRPNHMPGNLEARLECRRTKTHKKDIFEAQKSDPVLELEYGKTARA